MTIQIPDFSSVNILVIGDVMLDQYWHGGTSRISPEAPVPVVRVEGQEVRPGGAANVALNIASLGAKAQLVAITGQDAEADLLARTLEASKVQCHFSRQPSMHTIRKLRVISRHQQLIRLDFEKDYGQLDADLLMASFQQLLGGASLVLLSDYGKGTLAHPQQFIQAARMANIPVLVDPKGKDFSIYQGATLITPNFSEFEAVVGHCTSEAQIVERAQALISQCHLQYLLVTRGEQGMTLYSHQEAPRHLPTQAREVFDVTGAGDTVIAVLGAALAAGEKISHAMALANHAAGIVVGKLGTAAVSASELHQALMPTASGCGVIGEVDLLLQVKLAKERGEKIVMTNGCFDILHAGHVRYLAQAAELGDRLIVAVNDDASVARLKGNDRPLNALDSRMEVLAGLASVDWVVAFSEDTPERLICNCLPDLLVKGGDYQPEQIAGFHCVTQAGGNVKIIDFLPGHSTSGLIQQIRKEPPEGAAT